MEYRSTLLFYVNGKKHTVSNAQPETTLLQYLRDEGLTGTKLGCGEGGCGACTVMVSQLDTATAKIVHRAVNACLYPLCACDGRAIITVEGIGSTRTKLHPVQERLAEAHGSQCGFCTPGIVMSMYTLLRQNPTPSAAEIEENFDGNLCRCTGYRPILDAMKTFAVCTPSDVHGYHAAGNGTATTAEAAAVDDTAAVQAEAEKAQQGVCPSTGKPCDCGGAMTRVQKLADQFTAYDASSEIIFPPALHKFTPEPLRIAGEKSVWFRPTTLEQLLALKAEHPAARLIVGATETAIEAKFKGARFPVCIDPRAVAPLQELDVAADSMRIGMAVSLSHVGKRLEAEVAARGGADAPGVATLTTVLTQLRYFAGRQIRDAACVGGNLATASPISDLNPVWVAANATLTVASAARGTRTVPMRKFFLAYRKVDLQPDEVLVSLHVPLTRPLEFMAAYKQCKRRDDDIAIVTAALRVQLEARADGTHVVREAGLSYGGMAATTVSCPQTEAYLVGKEWSEAMLDGAYDALDADLPLPPNVPGGMVEFRRTLAVSFFFKFFIAVRTRVASASVAAADVSAAASMERPISSGVQEWEVAPNEMAPVGQPLVHAAAKVQVTGEAQYVDDTPPATNELYAALVTSTIACGTIDSVDASAALAMPGVVDFVQGSDVPLNKIGDGIGPRGLIYDEQVFASGRVNHYGQTIGAIVAESAAVAAEAVRAVRVSYTEEDGVYTIQEAIAAGTFHENGHRIVKGDAAGAFAACAHVVEGEVNVGSQDHFYLETHASIAVPGEDGEMTLYASTQNPSKTQHFVAHALGVPEHKVVCRVKRMGGGFGGKETRSIPYSCVVAVAARKLNRPVRIMLDRDTDMSGSGQRHPFHAKYKVGVLADGRVHALSVQLYSNAGYSYDLSLPVMDRALFHIDNVYNIANVDVVGYLCRTNNQSHTAFRGFGGPQALFIAEVYLEHVARTLGKPVHELQAINMYTEGDRTHYGMELTHFHVPRLYAECKAKGEWEARRAAVAAFNAANKWKKRGIALVPNKFGISFTAKFLNQAGALVHVYTDGSVLVTHGGTEMGQGLHTKMKQVAARAFGIPYAMVHIAETATDKVPNTSPTAASASSDLNGEAVKVACEKILARLEPMRAKLGADAAWKDIVNAAYFERISLSATGFYRIPDLDYDFAVRDADGNSSGKPFAYFTFGSAIVEIELDVLSGDTNILRADIICDLGKSLNPSLDVGQIEGAFMQGVGLFTLEEVMWGSKEQGEWMRPGVPFTRGPSTYKIPGFGNVPIDMRVSLLKNSANPFAIHSSKAVGEPPLFLGAAAYFAIKDAIYAARKDNGLEGYFRVDSPLTPERARTACGDPLVSRYAQPGYQAKGSW